MSQDAPIPYPTRHEVESASNEQVKEWWRFLPSPKTEDEKRIIDRLALRFSQLPREVKFEARN